MTAADLASGSSPKPTPTPEILQEAARWFVLLASGDATEADRQRWQDWRTADARHEDAWRRAEAVTARFADIPDTQTTASVEALEARQDRRAQRRQILRGLGSLVGLLLIGGIGWQGWRRSDASADALTAVGEQRNLTLADGSHLSLDTDTVVDVVFNARERLIRLRRGRVLITTARPEGSGAAPPFRVETAEGRVQALGTRFAVRQESGTTHVAVMEARVAIHGADMADFGAGSAPILAAGEAARFNRQGLVDRRAAQPADSAWARGMLVADEMTLADFTAELARYRTTPLVCDPAVRALRISGTYPLTDPDRALAALARALPVRVEAQRAGDPAAGLIIQAR